MEGAKDSRVFRPPNPWLMALMGILRELYDIEDLKMNIKFEIEVLCKHLGLKIDEVPRATILVNRLQPRKDKNPDFNVRAAAPVPLPPSDTGSITGEMAQGLVDEHGKPVMVGGDGSGDGGG